MGMETHGISSGSAKNPFWHWGPACALSSLQVFLTEYAGPLFIYLLFYIRPALIYGAEAADMPRKEVVQ